MEGFEPLQYGFDGIIRLMSTNATRADIDEVLGIIKDFMGQVSEQFKRVNTRLDVLDQKYDHLVSTIDGFIGRIDK